MKKIFCLIFVTNTISALSQDIVNTIINFESNSGLINIDTSQNDNIWQIGKPQKLIFDSAYSVPNGIITDTVGYYPSGNHSSFQLIMKPDTMGWWYSNIAVPVISFRHRFETDKYKDGGYIEISPDGGQSWENMLSYIQPDTILGGIPAFTGISNGWQFNEISFHWCPIVYDSILIRFSFNSDSIQTNKEGWLIDDITLGLYICGGVNNNYKNFNNNLFPNPASEYLMVRDFSFPAIIKLFDIFGNKILDSIIYDIDQKININNLSSGIYFYRLTDKKGNSLFGKQMLIK